MSKTERSSASAEPGDAWDALNRQQRNLPILDSSFMRLCLTHFGDGTEHYIEATSAEGGVVAAVVKRIGFGRWQTFQPSQSPLGAMLYSPGVSVESARRALFRCLPGSALTLGAYQLDPSICTRPVDSPTIQTLNYIQTGHFRVERDFEEYWAARGSNLRQNLKKQQNRLEKEGRAVQVRILDAPDDISAAVTAYADLEARGWKAALGTSLAPGNAQAEFYTAFLRKYAAQREALILQLIVDDRLMASDLCVIRAGTLIIAKTTFDESESKLSAAPLMRRLALPLIRSAHGPLTVEFYGPMMEWHTKWADDARWMYHANLDRHSSLRTLRKLIHNTRFILSRPASAASG